MTTIIIDRQDPDLLLSSFISTGKEILQKCKEVNDKISGLIENEFSQFFSESIAKISEWCKTIQSKEIKILDNEKLKRARINHYISKGLPAPDSKDLPDFY